MIALHVSVMRIFCTIHLFHIYIYKADLLHNRCFDIYRDLPLLYMWQ